MHEPGSREIALVESGAGHAALRRPPLRARRGRLRDLRRRPAPPLREPRAGRGAPARRRLRRPAPQLDERPRRADRHATDAARQDLGRPRGRSRPALHRPAPRPRGHEPAGVRRAAARRAHGAPPRPHARDRRPQRARPTARARAAAIKDELSRVQVQTLERNCEEFGDPALLGRLRPPGDRARDRPRAGRHPARHDDRLRRLAHRDPRRVRRARLRHRHERGRARPRDAVPGADQAALDADPLRGRRPASASPRRT